MGDLRLFTPGSGAQAERSAKIGEQVAKALSDSTQALNGGVRPVPCSSLQELAVPGIVVEAGFLTNPVESAQLQTNEYQDRIAQGLAAAIKGLAGSKNASGGDKP